MKGLLSRRTGFVLVGLSVAVVTLVGVGVALGTPVIPGSPPLTATTLADVNLVNSVNVHGQIHLEAEGPVEVFHVSNTAGPGFSSGWHKHTGPVIITVTAGTLTFYEANCQKTPVTVGQGYIETPGHPILARNEGSISAAWVTTQIIPVGASKRVDLITGLCGLL